MGQQGCGQRGERGAAGPEVDDQPTVGWQGRNQTGKDNRRLAAARRADDGQQGFAGDLLPQPGGGGFAAEEVAGVGGAEGGQAAVGAGRPAGRGQFGPGLDEHRRGDDVGGAHTGFRVGAGHQTDDAFQRFVPDGAAAEAGLDLVATGPAIDLQPALGLPAAHDALGPHAAAAILRKAKDAEGVVPEIAGADKADRPGRRRRGSQR